MTLVAWISTRSSARMLPRTSPPMIASREITSPSTSPPLPTSTCRPARTVPTTVPSIFTTPSAVMSPTTRIPAPMIERPVSDSGAPCPFSVKIAMLVLLFDDRERIERPALAADLEMEVRGGGTPRTAGQGDHLPRSHRVAFVHEETRGVPIHRLIPLSVPQEDEQPIRGVGPCGLDHSAAGGPDGRSRGHRDVDPRVRLRRVTGAYLTPGHEPRDVEGPLGGSGRAGRVARQRVGRCRPHGHGPHEIAARGDGLLRRRLHAQERAELLIVRLGPIQCTGELLHAAVFLSQPRHLPLQHGRTRRRPPDRSREGEKEHDRKPDDQRTPFPDLERPQREAILVRRELPVGMNDDRDATVLHPSKGAPRISSSRRARWSFE